MIKKIKEFMGWEENTIGDLIGILIIILVIIVMCIGGFMKWEGFGGKKNADIKVSIRKYRENKIKEETRKREKIEKRNIKQFKNMF